MVDVRQADLSRDETALRAQFLAANESFYHGYEWPLEVDADAKWFATHRVGFGKIRTVLGAYDNGKLIGFVEVGIQKLPGFFKKSTVGRIAYVHVIPAQRNRGLARQLLRQAEAWARERGAEDMHAEVMVLNELGQAAFNGAGYDAYYKLMRRAL
jgi:ribosomal protein S18 acetylase RimI-like enzyme